MVSDSKAVLGWYFDGRSGTRYPASLARTPAGIEFTVDNGEKQVWPPGSWRTSVDPAFSYVRIERLPYSGESLVVEDESFVRSIASGPSVNAVIQKREGIALFVLAIAAIAICAGLWFAYPAITKTIAFALPNRAEERAGKFIADSLAPVSDRLTGPDVEEPMRQLVSRLEKNTPHPYNWQVSIAKDDIVNAWAAPGGNLVIYRGLVCAMNSPDQLAAILGHEMTHVLERHSTRNLVGTLGIRFGIALIFGGGDQLIDGATMLGALHYMRADEESADNGALEILAKANIDPSALSTSFEELAKKAPDLPGALRYISTHPPLAQRRLKAAVEGRRSGDWTPSLDDAAWKRLRVSCQCKSPEQRKKP